MLTICIAPQKQEIISADGGHYSVSTALIYNGKKFKDLRTHESLFAITEVRFVLLGIEGHREINIPKALRIAIVTFLQKYHAQTNISFDCYAFANLAAGVSTHKVTYMLRFWKIFPSEGNHTLGDTVFLLRDERRFCHAAIYIGYGLYISVWGAGGDLEIATLADMKKDFDAYKVMRALPLRSPI